MNYLDDGQLAHLGGGLAQLDGRLAQLGGGLAHLEGSRVRWGRSVEADQGIQDQHSPSFWNAKADHQGLQDDHSHSFVLQWAVSVIHIIDSEDLKLAEYTAD